MDLASYTFAFLCLLRVGYCQVQESVSCFVPSLVRAQRSCVMAEHPAGEEVAAQLVEHFEPVRGNLTFKWIPGDGECQFRSIACQVAHYGYEGFRRLREDVARHVELRADDYLEYRCNGKDV